MGKRIQPVQILRYQFALVLFFVFFNVQPAQSWGGRGHSLICESAIHLVKNNTLKQYLINKTNAITYLCNLPDTYWRSVPGAESGGATHFFEIDLVGLTIQSVSVNKSFGQLTQDFKGKQNLITKRPILSVSRELGSSWWRANQFFNKAVLAGKKAKLKKTLDRDDQDIFEFWVMMGLLGHFVADNAQPFHNTKNYDGWENGHGGIHGYYESDLVNALPSSVIVDVIKSYPSIEKELDLKNSKTILVNMRNLSVLSYADLSIIMKNDPLLEPSTSRKEKGMELKTPAKRKSPDAVIQIFQPMLVTHLARAAALLAHTWDQIFEAAGSPPVELDHSFKFPHQFPFVEPDYIED
ncbi:MAG: hypothetical protein RJB66_1228 [Pseudomonadota bacterium]|jgi:hypothetical protein